MHENAFWNSVMFDNHAVRETGRANADRSGHARATILRRVFSYQIYANPKELGLKLVKQTHSYLVWVADPLGEKPID